MATLKTHGLTKHFGRKVVLDDINLTFEPHKIYGLIGVNGVGKSTLFNLLTNRIYPSAGSVSLNDTTITKQDNVTTTLIHLMSEMNLTHSQDKLKRIIKETQLLQPGFDQALAQEMLTAFDLNPNQKMNQLSTGYRTIFKMILALSVPAEIVLLDEPTLGLDANHREMLYRFILKAYEQRPRTVVIATHLIDEISPLLERVIIMANNQILIDDSLEQVLADSYLISGNQADVATYTQDLNVLTQTSFGNVNQCSIFDQLPEYREIPDQVKIEHLNLQQLFIQLAQKEAR